MEDTQDFRTGILECKNGNASFYEKDFNFCITSNVISPKKFYEAPDMYSLVQENQFLTGTTHSGQHIEIYTGDSNIHPLPSCSPFQIHTSMYLIQSSNTIGIPDWNTFDGIRFEGGTLNNLFSYHNVSTKYFPGGCTITDSDYTLSGSIETSYGKVDIIIGWFTQHTAKPNKMIVSQNTGYIDLTFDKPISRQEAFENIENVRTLLGFMCYRKNVDFDSIYLQKKHTQETSETPTSEFYNDAQVFIQYDFSPTRKRPLDSICFDELGKNVFDLFEMIYDRKKFNPFHFLDFIPNSDESAKWISGEMIRDVATFIECEYHRASQEKDSKTKKLFEDSERLKNLKSKLHQVLSQDESENSPFPKSTHNNIEKNINKIAFSSCNTDFALYEAYKDITRFIISTPSPLKALSESDTSEFRKYRNGKSHGRRMALNTNIGITTLYLIASGYCSILHRAKVDDSILKKLCKKHFLV